MVVMVLWLCVFFRLFMHSDKNMIFFFECVVSIFFGINLSLGKY